MIALTLFAASTLWSGYADDAAVEGLRPANEIRAALRAVEPQLQECDPPNEVVVDVEVLASGFVDHITPLSSQNGDIACISQALRALSLGDRGKETSTHFIVRFTSERPTTPSPRALNAALAPVRDDVARCVVNARAHNPDNGGSVVLRVKLNDRGDAVDVNAHEGTLDNDDARTCIAASLRKLHVDTASAADSVYVLHVDKPKVTAAVDAHSSSFLNKPTLFDVLGCASAFH